MAKNSTQDLTARLKAEIEPLVREQGLWLEGILCKRAPKAQLVRITVDLPAGPGGVTSDQLTDVTRLISKHLDKIDVIPGTYTLEISTPGAERPLTEPRHFDRAVGRLISLERTDGVVLCGRIDNFTDNTIELEIEDRQEYVRVNLSQVKSARVLLELKHVGHDNPTKAAQEA